MQRFVSNETGYLEWLKANGNGFVVNSRIETDPSYLVLHRSNCWTINAGKKYVPGAFTDRSYSKLVAKDESELQNALAELGVADFSKRCALCRP